MNPGLAKLQPYPFERLRALRAGVEPNAAFTPINLSIGEPQHPTPRLVLDALIAALEGTAKYPATKGSDELRAAIAQWLTQRYRLPAGAVRADTMVLPVNGTREALFAIAQCLTNRDAAKDLVAMPNPFYQIYEGAALLAGATPYFLPCPAEGGFLPDFAAVDPAVWARCTLVYVCSPANPSGAVMTQAEFVQLLELADRHDFRVVSDECYSELYLDELAPPCGLLEAAWASGRTDFRRCLVMHSLSKRSNAPGLRSGFVAGDPALMAEFLRYRTYHGAAMPLQVQAASVAAWRDEAHVIANRALYRAKFQAVTPILADVATIASPAGGFYLWPQFDCDDTALCRRLWEHAHVLTLPGSFLARVAGGQNPGRGRLRLALVASLEDCVEAARRIRTLLQLS
ncbi:MAG: succinyldiaminopimelate transaminase [Gammaproteobacteria bacterium]|nr:succinyldiaminopimelate transaminase [Gammaproteobacteria bacterium]